METRGDNVSRDKGRQGQWRHGETSVETRGDVSGDTGRQGQLRHGETMSVETRGDKVSVGSWDTNIHHMGASQVLYPVLRVQLQYSEICRFGWEMTPNDG